MGWGGGILCCRGNELSLAKEHLSGEPCALMFLCAARTGWERLLHVPCVFVQNSCIPRTAGLPPHPGHTPERCVAPGRGRAA